MPSLRSTAPFLAFVVSTATAAGPKQCPIDVPLSCHNTGPFEDTCCLLSTGQLVQTQYWDSSPPTGPADSWTIHGLWPDNCDGSFPSSCDTSRAYKNLGSILSSGGGKETLSYMQKYWKDYQGKDEQFWEHEWSKHGTCISTLEPKCYDDYRRGEEAVDFFTRAVEVFKTLPTYKWLAEQGITPDKKKTYETADIQAALTRRHGAPVTLGCKGKNLHEVWYYFNVKGNLQEGQFFATQPDGAKSSCGKTVIYAPKQK